MMGPTSSMTAPGPSLLSPSHSRLGGGVGATWDNHGRIDLRLATPLRKAAFQTERGDTRLLLSVTTRILPWGR